MAWNANVPATFGVCVNVVPSTTPPARVNALDVAAAGAVQVPLVNHENVTVPVGVGQAGLAGHRRLVVHGRARGHRRHRRVRASWMTVTVLDVIVVTGQRLTRPDRTGVRAVTRVGRPERERPEDARRLRERRPVRGPQGRSA